MAYETNYLVLIYGLTMHQLQFYDSVITNDDSVYSTFPSVVKILSIASSDTVITCKYL